MYCGSLSPFVQIDADGNRPSSYKENMRQSEPACTSVASPHTVNNGGAYPKVALTPWQRVPMRCDARAHNALVSADERPRAARSERAGTATVRACVRVTKHSAPYGSFMRRWSVLHACVRGHGTVPSGGQDEWRCALRSISTVSPEISSCNTHTQRNVRRAPRN